MYFIHFYSRESGKLSKKHGYKTKNEARIDLGKNGFTHEGNDVWQSPDWIARIKREK